MTELSKWVEKSGVGDEAASGSAVRSAVENTITTGGQCPIVIKLDFGIQPQRPCRPHRDRRPPCVTLCGIGIKNFFAKPIDNRK